MKGNLTGAPQQVRLIRSLKCTCQVVFTHMLVLLFDKLLHHLLISLRIHQRIYPLRQRSNIYLLRGLSGCHYLFTRDIEYADGTVCQIFIRENVQLIQYRIGRNVEGAAGIE